MKSLVPALVGLLLLGGCASTAPVSSGSCHPSTDLPATKAIKKVPEKNTTFEELYSLLALERHDHAADVRDYNSLYEQCVSK